MITILAVAWAGPMPSGHAAAPVLSHPERDWALFVVFALVLAAVAWWADRPLRGEADED